MSADSFVKVVAKEINLVYYIERKRICEVHSELYLWCSIQIESLKTMSEWIMCAVLTPVIKFAI